MNVSKIIGGLLLIGAGCGTALAQSRTAVRPLTVAPPPAISSTIGAHGRISIGQPSRDHRDKDWRHRHRDHDRSRRPILGLGLVGYGGGYVYTEPARDMFGYFGAGGDVAQIDGEAVYDYDRSYPYDRFDDPQSARGPAEPYRCETDWVTGGSGAEPVPVRVCRR